MVDTGVRERCGKVASRLALWIRGATFWPVVVTLNSIRFAPGWSRNPASTLGRVTVRIRAEVGIRCSHRIPSTSGLAATRQVELRHTGLCSLRSCPTNLSKKSVFTCSSKRCSGRIDSDHGWKRGPAGSLLCGRQVVRRKASIVPDTISFLSFRPPLFRNVAMRNS